MLAIATAVVLGRCASAAEGCMCDASQWIRLGTVVETDAGLRVVGGMTFGTTAPEQGVVEGVDAGATVLATDVGALTVDAQGRVTCGRGQQLSLVAVEYGQAIADQRCSAALAEAGLEPLQCRDVGCGCSTSVTNLSLAALIILTIRSRARRRADL